MRRLASVRPTRPALSVACLALATAILVSCAPTAVQRPSAPLPAALDAFDVSGRLSASHGSEGVTANFQWRHQGTRDDLELVSPLGQTIAVLTGDSAGARLQTSDGRVLTAQSWTKLTEQGLGWPLPVDGLTYWIQGVPRPGVPFRTEPDEAGRVAVLHQEGWTILYPAYVAVGDASRPSRITADYPAMELRLAIDRWR
jgi:outer membrane lipoprotein LolB